MLDNLLRIYNTVSDWAARIPQPVIHGVLNLIYLLSSGLALYYAFTCPLYARAVAIAGLTCLVGINGLAFIFNIMDYKQTKK